MVTGRGGQREDGGDVNARADAPAPDRDPARVDVDTASPASPRDPGTLVAELQAARPELRVTPLLGPELAKVLAAAERAWPGFSLSTPRFLAFLADKLPVGEPLEPALAQLCIDDLYLACACSDRDPRALAEFDRQLVPIVERAATRRGATASQAAEVQQIVRERLLLPRVAGDDEQARIADFSGRGNLRAWIRVVATRETLRLLGRPQREVPTDEDAVAALMPADAGVELEHFKAVYREEFKQAFREAIAALTDRERVLLRQHALDGLSIDRLADFYGVHRATTARWIDAARKSVLERTRKALGRRLHVPSAELDSIMRMIDSRLDITLPTLLRDANAADLPPPRRRG
jgi:RNA polymerase sigma-70 factor, ECF subfamily